MSSVISSSKIDVEIFQTRDGRWVGTKFRIDEWYEPFSGVTEDLPTTRTDLDTAAFATKEDAQKWVSDFDAAQDVARVEDLYA